MASSSPETPQPEHAEPEHTIEQSNLEFCVISGQGELRYRDPPVVVHQEKGACMVFVSFVALPEEVGVYFTTVILKADALAGIPTIREKL
jgi:hypothetical protein